jgi:hypothetical protein
VGAWRINDAGGKLEVSGEMFDGTKLSGPAGLRQAILNRSDAFISTFTENLLAYGLGRVTDYRDMPVVRAIAASAAASGNRFSSFALGIIKSPPFQMSVVDQVPSANGELAMKQPAVAEKPAAALAGTNNCAGL